MRIRLCTVFLQMTFLWTVMSVFNAVGNVVANINNNQNNNNNNNNNLNLNKISTTNTQVGSYSASLRIWIFMISTSLKSIFSSNFGAFQWEPIPLTTCTFQISANTNNANAISIMLPPPIPVLAGGRKLDAEKKFRRFLERQQKLEERRKKRDVCRNHSQ